MSTSDQERSDHQSAAQDLFLRYVKEVRSGGTQAFEALCDEHAEQADYLRELHSIYKLGAALASSQSFHESVRQRYGDIDEITLSVEEDSSVDETVATHADEGSLKRTYDTSRYALEGEIARGGMGVVFRVKDQDLSRSIAMKVMRPGEEGEAKKQSDSLALARFLEEAQVMAQLDHPGIVPVHEVGFDTDGQIYFTMKLVKGKNFNEICALVRENKDDWNTSRALSVLVRVCQAVAFAHSKGVIHRDLKPSNIMVGRFGEAYVMDWGLAKVKGRKDLHDIRVQPDHEATQTSIQSFRKATDSDQEFALVTLDGSVLGTPAYMPPEQASGRVDDVDERSDVYSLGAVLYKLLTGTAPYLKEGARLSPHTILGLVVQGPPTAVEKQNPKVSAELAAICRKAMSRDCSDRYRSCQDLAEDLQAYLDRRVVRAYRTGALAELRSWVTRNSGTAALAISLVIVAIAGTALSVWKARQQQSLARSLKDELFISDMAIARQALEKNDVSKLRRILSEYSDYEAGKKRFEWWYLTNALEESDRVHRIPIPYKAYALDVTSDEKTIVVGMSNGSVVVLDSASGQIKATLESGDEHWAIAFPVLTADDQHVAYSRGSDVVIKAIDPSRQSGNRVLSGHAREVTELAMSPDGRRLATVGLDGAARIWSIDSGECLSVFKYSDDRLLSVAWSPDQKTLATGNAAGEIIFWNIDANQILQVFHRHSSPVWSLVYSPDGQTIVSASNDNSILRWNTSLGTPVGKRMFHSDDVRCVRFSPCGQYLASSSRAGDIKFWSAGGQELKALSHHSGAVMDLVFSSDGKRVITAGSDFSVAIADIDLHKDRDTIETGYWPDSIVLSTETHRLYYTAPGIDEHAQGNVPSQRRVLIWNMARGQYEDPIEINDFPEAIDLSSDQVLAVGCHGGDVQFWDVKDHPRMLNTIPQTSRVRSLAFSPTDHLLATGHDNGVIQLWNIDNDIDGGPKLLFHQKAVLSLAFSSDGLLLAAGSVDKQASVWRAKDAKLVSYFVGHRAAVMSVDISPDAKTLVTGGWDYDVRLWPISSDEPLGNPTSLERSVLLGRHHQWVSSVCFSCDGLDLYTSSGDHTVGIWDLGRRRQRFSLSHGNAIKRLVVSPELNMLITGGRDNSIRFWRGSPGASN